MHSIRVRPHNSDSEGRRFESCRAYQRQNNTIRSSAAAGGVGSTDGVVFPFRLKPTSLGFESVFCYVLKIGWPCHIPRLTRAVGVSLYLQRIMQLTAGGFFCSYRKHSLRRISVAM